MADLKISALTSATTPLAGTEVVPLVQSSTTKKTAVSTLMGFGPAVRAYQNASISIANATYTVLPINTKVFDTNTNFDTTTYRFTPNIAGYYQVNAIANYFPAGGTNCFLSIYKNGTEYIRGPAIVAGTSFGLVSLGIVPVNGTTDYLDIRLFQASGISQTYNPGANFSAINASLVRTT
jgi:hypothetical protein